MFFILLTRGDDATVARNSRYIALWTSVPTFLISLLIWVKFDPSTANFQMMESIEWIEGTNIGYRMGVDGISIFCTPINVLTPCILASWEAIEHRVREYMVAFLILETMIVGMFYALDILVFTSFLKVF